MELTGRLNNMPEPITIIIPMAGLGSRMRPHTWSKPKPLVSLAGGRVLDHLMAMFQTLPEKDDAQFVFILSPNQGDLIQKYMSRHYPQCKVDYVIQKEMRGQSDALWQARASLKGRMIMVFSDTLIESSLAFMANDNSDAIAWVKAVPDPRRFGVAEIDSNGWVTRLIEKPKDIDNNLAVVGFYYFKAIEEQVNRKVMLKGEFFLTGAINILLEMGVKMRIENVAYWLDAGTPDAILETNRFFLEHGRDNQPLQSNLEDTTLIPPVHIHPGARISGSTIGPHVSIGEGTIIEGSTLKDSIVGDSAHISQSQLETSLIGDMVVISGLQGKFNLGDNSTAVK
jgi:glucose-1-phosphate thymidylyltransferase